MQGENPPPTRAERFFAARCYTRNWLDECDLHPCPGNFTDICKRFAADNEDSIVKMYGLFELAQRLIPDSLALRDRQHRARGVLRPPEWFLSSP